MPLPGVLCYLSSSSCILNWKIHLYHHTSSLCLHHSLALQLDLSFRAGPHIFVQLSPIHRQSSVAGITTARCAKLCYNSLTLQKTCVLPSLSPFGAVDSLGSGASSGCSVHLFRLIKWINVSFSHFDLHFHIHLEGKKGKAKQANFSSMIGSHTRQKAWSLIPVLKKWFWTHVWVTWSLLCLFP